MVRGETRGVRTAHARHTHLLIRGGLLGAHVQQSDACVRMAVCTQLLVRGQRLELRDAAQALEEALKRQAVLFQEPTIARTVDDAPAWYSQGVCTDAAL